jgi:phage FluMu gp28-like protein
MGSSELVLYPYQKQWLADKSRFKIGMFARQTGKTFTSTLEIVLSALENKERWVILSRGERQAKEAMDEGIKRHLQAIETAFEFLEYQFDPLIRAMEVSLPNGSKITALPANPDTARGFSANVFLDEFAFHADSRKIWQALFPVISAGHKLRIVSTPNGKANKFYELMTAGGDQWSQHVVDIYQAVAQGLPRDIEQLKDALNDPDAWAQEFELQWLDEASAWLPYDLINACEDSGLVQIDGGYVKTMLPVDAMPECYLGWDIARRRDLSILWVIGKYDDGFRTLEVVRMRGRKFEEQLREFDRLMDSYHIRRACLDQTGMGEVIVEICQKQWGLYRVEGVLFTGAVKQDLATKLKQKFEDKSIRVPADRDIRDSLHAVKKMTTTAGAVRFDAERTEAGHADYFWSCALAIFGIGTATPIDYGVVETKDEYVDFDSEFSWRGF